MTTTALFHPARYTALSLSFLTDTFAKLAAGAREGREIKTRYDAVSGLTPTELERLGLTRADIARMD